MYNSRKLNATDNKTYRKYRKHFRCLPNKTLHPRHDTNKSKSDVYFLISRTIVELLLFKQYNDHGRRTFSYETIKINLCHVGVIP